MPDADRIFLNGIDFATGKYAVPPFTIEELAKNVRASPGGVDIGELRSPAARAFAPPFGKDLNKLEDVGWGIVFPEETPPEVRSALAPLLEYRRKQTDNLFKVLDYKKGEQVRDWYRRHQIVPGDLEPELVPYYLLLIGPPTGIPFDFQYLLGVDYAVGRLAFDKAADYEQYARSLLAYETTAAVSNSREIVYWGTRHPGDAATNMSASLLIEPLANGVDGAAGSIKKPIHKEVGYERQLYTADDATKERLLNTLRTGKPPALLFTASHGMAINAGRPNQLSDQGSLVCQDWPGYGALRAEHYFAAADIPDAANVSGLVAFFFACFGAGTPDSDQFLINLSRAGTMPPLAPQPFVAALPRRLLSHPKGSALAVIGHVDRAWGFSIQAPKMTGAQIGIFRNSLGELLSGSPVGHTLARRFGERFAELSAILLSSLSPTAPALARLSDRDLVSYWLERNDAQNYVMLGDPAAHIRNDALV